MINVPDKTSNYSRYYIECCYGKHMFIIEVIYFPLIHNFKIIAWDIMYV